MECEVKKQRTHQRNRRRERAQRMQAQRESKAGQKDIESGEDESPVREKPPRPPNRRKKLKEPLYEEDIIDGFAILAFKSYEDLENAVKKHSEKHHAAARHNNNILAVAGEARSKKQDPKQPGPSPPPPRLHHLHVLHNGAQPPTANVLQGFDSGGGGVSSGGGGSSSPGPDQRLNGPSGGLNPLSLRDGSRDDRLSDASSHSSSGRGYICDSESDDDKASDAGSDLFTTSRKREFSGELRRPPQQPDLVPRGDLPTSPRRSNTSNNALPPPPPPPPPSLPGVISLRVPHRPSRRPMGPQQPASARASPDSPPPRLLSSASPPPSAASAAAAAAAAVDSSAAGAPVAPSSAPPPYPPLYAPYSNATVPGTAPSPYLAPSSPGANAAIHRNEQQQQQRHSKSPLAKPPNHQAPPGVPTPHLSPMQPMGGQPPPTGLWAPAVAPPPSSVAAAGHREARPHSPRGHSPTRERDSYSSNVSSLSRGSSTTPATCPAPSSPFGAPPSCVPAVSASPGGLLSFSSKSPVVSASVGAAWTGVALNPPPASAPSAAAGSPSISVAQHSGPFAPPTSAPSSLFPPPLPVSSSASSSNVSAPAPTSTTASAPPPVPSNPNPFSAESLFGSSQAADMLRRELDNRFLASSQERGSLGPPPFLRAEMHHHQHQHTHVHQHTTPLLPPGCSALIPPPTLFKDIPKLASVESPFYRQSSIGMSTGYPAFTPGLLHHGLSSGTPFTPPSHLTPFAPKMPDPSKPKPVKTGRWNAMHVRIAWEIHYHQQSKAVEAKAAAAAAVAAGKASSELLRPPSGPHHLFSNLPPPAAASQSSTAFSALPPGHAPPPPHHHRAPPFVEPPPPPSFLASHIPPFGRFPGFAPPGASPFAGLSSLQGVFPGRGDLAASLGPMGSPVHDQWSRLHRTPPGFPPPPHGSPWSLGKSELDRREMEEREREQRMRRERERAEMERERAERELREKERAAAQAAAELAKRKSQQEAAERERREREREIEKREQREREKQMRERQQHLQQLQQQHHQHHSSIHHHRSSSATPPDRKPQLPRERSPHRLENGEVKVKEERREEDKAAVAAANAAMLEQRDRYMYMARQAQGMSRSVGLPSPGMSHPAPPFSTAWDPYSHHRYDPMAMRFNPLSAAAAAHAAAAAMYREREEAMVAPPPPHLFSSPLMSQDRGKGVPPPPPGHKLATPPPSHPMYPQLPPPSLLGGSNVPGKMLGAPQAPPPHKLSTPPSRLDMDLHKPPKEESQSR